MPESGEVSPGPPGTGALLELGEELRRLRRNRRLTGEQLADRLAISQGKISKIETGRVRPKPGDVKRIAVELQAPPDEVDRLVAWAQRLEFAPLPTARARRDDPSSSVDIRRTGEPQLPNQDEVAAREAAVTHLRNFEPLIIPGLLQTSEYTRRIVNGYFRFAFGESEPYWQEAAYAISRRTERQTQLYHPGKRFEFVFLESALSNQLLTPGFMLAQVDRIEEASKLPNVTVRIVPRSAELQYPPVSGFTLFDGATVLLEVGGTPFIMRGQNEVAFHDRLFEHYSELGTADLAPILEDYKARLAEAARPKADDTAGDPTSGG